MGMKLDEIRKELPDYKKKIESLKDTILYRIEAVIYG